MMTQCVVLLVLCALGSCSFIVDNKDILSDNITANVISMFTEHELLFHYDHTTRDRVDSIISKIVYSKNKIILMANYDFYVDDNNDTASTNKSINFVKPLGYKFLHVVMLYNYSKFEKYTTSSIYSFEYLDIVLVIKRFDGKHTEKLTDFDIFIENVNRAGSFFLFDVSNFTLYNNCFYCGERAYVWASITNLANATNTDFLFAKLLVKSIYDNEFSNFSGHVFAVGYTIYKPFFWCQLVQENNVTEIEVAGSEGEILFILQEKLNIYFQIIEITDINNSWYLITETVKNGTFDWVVGGITASRSRLEVLEFTSTINYEAFVILYARRLYPWMSWMSLISPFHLYVWIAIFVTALAVSTILFIIARSIRPRRKLVYYNFIQGAFRYLVEQPLPFALNYMKYRWTVFLIITLWLFVAQIITNSYKGKITSTLINYEGVEYKTVDQLLQSKFNFYMHTNDEIMVKETLKLSNDSTYLEILKHLEVYTDFCDQVKQITFHKKAIIGQETVMQYVMRKKCLSILNTKLLESLRLFRKKLIPFPQAWPVAKNIPYLVALNNVIGRLNAAGIINKWNNDYAPVARTVLKSNEKRSKVHESSTGDVKMTLKSITGLLILWFLGIIAAIISFINELRLGKNVKQ